MNRVINQQKGFTLIELLLAMSFVSILLMAITVTVIQISNIYTKGLTMKAVDQAGQSVSQDVRRSIEAVRPLDLGATPAGGANYRPSIAAGGDIAKPEGGRLCTGSYSYVWNNGASLATPVNKYSDSAELIRLVKVADSGALYCSDPARTIDRGAAVEMLNVSDRELAVQKFSIQTVASSSSLQQALYWIRIEIGTNDREALEQLTTLDTTCRPPAESEGLRDYCAVNTFEFTARAGNTGGGR